MTSITTSTRDLVAFLLARIDDDETAVRRASRARARSSADTSAEPDEAVERQRAECLAKRKVIGAAQHLLILRDQPNEVAIRDQARKVLYALAALYQSHTGFRPEWTERSPHHA